MARPTTASPTFYIGAGEVSGGESVRTSVASTVDSWGTGEDHASSPTHAVYSGQAEASAPATQTALEDDHRRAKASSSKRGPSTSSNHRASVASFLSNQSLPEDVQASHPSPNASPRRARPSNYKRVSVASVISGFSLPEECPSGDNATNPAVDDDPARSFLFPSCDSPLKQDKPSHPSGSTSSVVFPRSDARPTSPTSSRPPSSPHAPRSVLTRTTSTSSRISRTVSFPSLPNPILHGLQPPSRPAQAQVSTSISTFQQRPTIGVRVPKRAKTVSLTGRPERVVDGGRVAWGRTKEEGREEETRRRKIEEKKVKVVREILDSEKVYVQGLETVIEHFMQPLLARAELPSPLLPKKTVNDLFSSVVEIHAFSTAFLGALETAVQSDTSGRTEGEPVSGLGPLAQRSGSTWIGTLQGLSSGTDKKEELEEVEVLSTLGEDLPRSTPIDFFNPSPSSRPLSSPGNVGGPRPQPRPAQIVHVLAKHMPFLSLYHPFIGAYPSSSALLAQLRKAHDTPFALWLAEREGDDRCRKLRLGDWLLTVVQRVPRYLLLIKDLLKCTPEEDPEHEELQKVLTMVDNVTETLNSRLHDIAATQQLIGLHRSFTSIPQGFSLVVPGRRLLKQGDLSKVCRRKAEDRTFWLFSDVLVYGTTSTTNALSASKSMVSISTWMGLNVGPPPRSTSMDLKDHARPAVPSLDPAGDKGRYTFHRQIRLDELTVVATGDGRKKEHAFELLSPEKSFAVIASCQEEKDAWIDAIREAKSRLLSNLRTLNTEEEHTMRRHRRRSLQAVPFADYRQPVTQPDPLAKRVSMDVASVADHRSPTVETFIAAVWVPDTRAEKCMRCQEPFTVFRRRHHCRMCGLLCCHPCSSKSVQLNDSTDPSTSIFGLRTCDPCYSSLFPSILANAQRTDRPTSSHSTSTQSHDSPPTPVSKDVPLPPSVAQQKATRAAGLAKDPTVAPAIGLEPPTPLDELAPTASYFAARSSPTCGVTPSCLGTLKPTSQRSTIFPAFASAVSSPATHHSNLPKTLGTLKGSMPGPPKPSVSPFARPARGRLLSATNDRFSVFVGGGAGGSDWEGKAEMVKHSSERDRRESGERWGDASLRSGEAADHLRRVLQGGA